MLQPVAMKYAQVESLSFETTPIGAVTARYKAAMNANTNGATNQATPPSSNNLIDM